MTCGTQADHYRGVALIAIGMLDGMRKAIPALSVDRDILLAGALVHDVGKAYEFANWDRWKAERSHSGSPALRHPVYGAHLALRMGLPESVVHCIAAHSYLGEGQFVEASIGTTLVQCARFAF
jgi:putative nucleotidyltransferase with HDIG domain